MQATPEKLQLEMLRDEFAASIAHDILSPLGSIRGYTELMGESILTKEEQKEFLGEISAAIANTIEMAHQMQDFALLGDVKHLTLSQIDLHDTLDDLVDSLERISNSKSIKIRLETSGMARNINSDLKLIYRSIANLVENAIACSRSNSEIVIALAFTDDSVAVRVRDTGPGFPEDMLPLVFDRYYRSKNAPMGMPRCGLGLVLVKATAEALGGSVSARNLGNSGAELSITLPA